MRDRQVVIRRWSLNLTNRLVGGFGLSVLVPVVGFQIALPPAIFLPVRSWVRDKVFAADNAFHDDTSKRSIVDGLAFPTVVVSFAFAVGEFDLLNDNVNRSEFDAVLVLVFATLQATFDEEL